MNADDEKIDEFLRGKTIIAFHPITEGIALVIKDDKREYTAHITVTCFGRELAKVVRGKSLK